MSNDCLRKRLPNTHTSSESMMRNSMSSRPNGKFAQKTLSRFKRFSYIAIASKTDTCCAHPNWNSSTQQTDLETYVDNVGQCARRNDICVANKAPEPQWEDWETCAHNEDTQIKHALHHDAPKKCLVQDRKLPPILSFWTTTKCDALLANALRMYRATNRHLAHTVRTRSDAKLTATISTRQRQYGRMCEFETTKPEMCPVRHHHARKNMTP